MPPKLLAKGADRTSGVLPVSAAARANPTRGASTRLKLEVRRLPPGLTLTEFEETLGDEWKLGNGRVNWREYRTGKTRASGSGKVPEQSRCYLHFVNDTCVREFESRFLEVAFNDKAGTHRNPELKNLQPTLEYAANQRTPLQQAKPKTDNRQGTIDQDPEFIAFLESETQPISKPTALEAILVDKEAETKQAKTTPLIEDLREKKANKAKNAQAKAEKAEKEKKSPAVKGPSKDATPTDKDTAKAATQLKVDQAAKDAAKALNKQAASKQQNQAAQQTLSPKIGPSPKARRPAQSPKSQIATPASAQSPAASTPSGPAAQRVPPSQRQRGSTDGIKKMLQKDLGIKPKATRPNQATEASTPASTVPSQGGASYTSAAVAPTSVTSSSTSPTEPKVLPVKAYLKHANPSQGMTEVLIQQSLTSFGEVVNVTIDPRKGTAIAMFKQNEGLKKALEARRVPVANGAVEVLEFRDRPPPGATPRGGFRGGRGGRGGSRGGAQASVNGTTGSLASSSIAP